MVRPLAITSTGELRAYPSSRDRFLGLGVPVILLCMHTTKGCKRAEVSELVHDAHTLQRAILTPCTARR